MINSTGLHISMVTLYLNMYQHYVPIYTQIVGRSAHSEQGKDLRIFIIPY
jgi:hypothetical protein